MSASERLQHDYLTCSQCSKPFNQPKTLPCLHNFCKMCLSAYLENAMSGGRHSSFECPECRKKIYVPDPSKAVNRWAAQFPTNFTLSGMIEAIAEETKGKGQGMDMAKAVNERRAESHTDSPKAERARGQASAGGNSLAMQRNDTQAKLTMLQSNLQKEGQSLDKAMASLNQDLQEQKQRLDKSFQKVYQLIEARKMQLLEEVVNNFAEEEDKISQAKQSCENDLKSLKSCTELLSSIGGKLMSDSIVVEMLEAITAQIKEMESRPSEIVTRSVKFEQTLDAGRSILQLVEDLGHVTISASGDVDRVESTRGGGAREVLKSGPGSSETDGVYEADPRILAKPKFLNAFSTKSADGKCRQVYDITVMPNGTIVMTAYGENIIQAAKMMGNEYKIFSQLQLDSAPKCVVAISTFYVGVVGSSCIYLVGIDDKLSLKKTIHTGKDYSSIATYSETNLILASQKPPCIDFVGLNGFISETIDRDHTTGIVLLHNPQFIASTKEGVILVTDIGRMSRVIGVNNAGKLKFQYPADGSQAALDSPQGICCNSQGLVFVVDRGAHKVIVLNQAGEKVKDILTVEDGITDPCAIAVDEKDHLYVTNDFTEILVFQVK